MDHKHLVVMGIRRAITEWRDKTARRPVVGYGTGGMHWIHEHTRAVNALNYANAHDQTTWRHLMHEAVTDAFSSHEAAEAPLTDALQRSIVIATLWLEDIAQERQAPQ